MIESQKEALPNLPNLFFLFLGSVAAEGGDGPQEKEEGAGERRLLAASHAPAGASPAVSCPVISHPFQ